MKRFLVAIVAGVLLASCASPPPASSGAGATLKPSPECEAAKLKALDPLPAGSLPDAVLRQARSGWVSVRYDVVAGKAQNIVVVSSEPPGLYDAYVVRHTSQYTEPTRATVRGCLATTNIRF